MTPNSVPAGQDSGMSWLVRVFTLAFIVGGWLLYAHGMENRRVADELRARGHTTLAKDPHKNPLDRLKERSQFGFYPTKAYLYVVDGIEYRHTTSKKEFDPIGKTVTYLPEDPNIHQVGDIEPEAGMPWWGYGFFLFLAAAWGGLTLAFFLIALCPSEESNPTRVGGWCIVSLAVAHFATAWVATTFLRMPFSMLLTRGVPLFVGGTVVAVVGVRLFAWCRGIGLQKPTEWAGASPVARPGIVRIGATSAVASPSSPPPIVEEQPMPAVVFSHNSIIACPICSATFSGVPDAKGFVICPQGHWFTLVCVRGVPASANADQPVRYDGEWGVSIPASEARLPDRPWYYMLLAMLAGASGCLGATFCSVLVMHLVAAIMTGFGATTSFNTFYTSRDSILLDLIFATVAVVFGGLRGVAHEGEMKGRPVNWRAFWWDMAGRSAADLGNIKNPSEGAFERVVTLIFAIVLASPVAFVLVVIWNR